jgi:hypothetical protein
LFRAISSLHKGFQIKNTSIISFSTVTNQNLK